MYYSPSDIFWFLLLAFVAWYVWANMAAKEQAKRAVSDHCKQLGVQLLDDTVMLARIRLRRDKRGHVSLQRSYEFEFTSTGQHRYSGTAILHGRRIEQMQLSPHHLS